MRQRHRDRSILEHILLGLVPYSKANMNLVFKPQKYFHDLELISKANRSTLQTTLSRAQRLGLVDRKRGAPILTKKGQERIKPYAPKILKKQVLLMVIFDIPENHAKQRRQLRSYLQQLDFKQTQKSVWTSNYDYRDELQIAIAELNIEPFVQLFEGAEILP